ncbi:MAG: 7-cyano-7-deazaguanine synthase QueC [Candidatus Hydrogenedentes bacterium]|nr:7-cyano-7-deazaguanine synthase QueC [Candidatus Hydrogenedentota bacterium]
MNSRKPRAVVLLSGGMDSCVCAALARRDCDPAFLHVSYGQRTETRELRAFREIAEFYSVYDTLEVRADHLRAIGGSSLTDTSRSVEKNALGESGIPSTYVPFRNANLLAIAVSWAEVLRAPFIYIGAVEQDSSGYPDCRRTFFDAFGRAVNEGTRPETRIDIRTPLIELSKSDIVRKGHKLGAPLHLSWSCYVNTDVACGRCDSCLLRKKAFSEAGIDDPIPYTRDDR